MKELHFVTTNDSKVELANKRLANFGVYVVKKPLPLLEIQSLKIEEVSESKATQAETMTREPFLIEDSAMYISSIGGFPGTLLKPVFQALGDEKFLRLLHEETDRSAVVVGQLIYVDPTNHEHKVFQGTYGGKISQKPRGENTRGWQVSRIFIPDGFDHTLAEMEEEQWNTFLEDFRNNDHYQKFGEWISNKSSVDPS